MSRPATDAVADSRMLRRASLAVAWQTGAAVALVVAVVVTLVYLAGLEQRRSATEDKARAKVDNAASYGLDLTGPQPMLLDGLPAECPEADVRRAAADLPRGQSWIEVCGGPFVAWVGDVDGARVTAVVSFIEQRAETRRLAVLSLQAGLAGILAAAAVGWLFGRRAVRPLGAALASQRRFVADASHELRTPLAIVLMRAQLLERTAPLDHAQRDELAQLARDTRAAADVVDDLLLVAETQHRPPPAEPVDLHDVATEVVSSFAARARLAGVRLQVTVGDEAAGPAGPQPSYVVPGARGALRRAVAGLVDNALAHSHRDGHVDVRLETTTREVVVAVVDDGDGLDPATAAELSQRFRRGSSGADDPTDPSAGIRLGLGLALVNEIAVAHGGRLGIDGQPGAGATVTVHVPRRPAGERKILRLGRARRRAPEVDRTGTADRTTRSDTPVP